MAYVGLKLLIVLYFIDKSGFLRITNFALPVQSRLVCSLEPEI